MAEVGGYNETGTFPEGEGETSDKSPFVPHQGEEGMEMKHRRQSGYEFPSITKSSASKHQETSFNTPSGIVVISHEQQKEEIERRTNKKFVNPNYKKFISGIDDYDRVYFKLRRDNAKMWYLDGDESKFPKTLQKALGKTREEVNNENYEKQQEEERKQAVREEILEKAKRDEAENAEKLEDAKSRVKELKRVGREHIDAKKNAASPEERVEIGKSIEVTRRSMRAVQKEVDDLIKGGDRLEQATRDANAQVEEGENKVETARERVNERLLSLRDRVKEIFKKHGFTVVSVMTAIGVVIGVIVSNLKAGLSKVAKGIGDGMKALGKKLGEILPGMIGAIASFIFHTAGEVIGFLAKNVWLLVVGLVVLAVEQFKKKSR